MMNTFIDESVLSDGQPDPKKLKPLIFDICGHHYYGLGEIVGNAFSDGLALK